MKALNSPSNKKIPTKIDKSTLEKSEKYFLKYFKQNIEEHDAENTKAHS